MKAIQQVESRQQAARPEPEDSMSKKVVVISVRISPELKAAVDQTVEASGLGLTDWLRGVVARAVHEGAFTPRKGRRKKRGRTS